MAVELATFKALSDKAIIPTRATAHSAGLDLYAAVDVIVAARGRALVGTALAITSMPQQCVYGRIASRSGLAWNHGIEVGAGVIDSDYTEEIKVLLHNHSDTPYQVQTGDRIAQLIFESSVTVQTGFSLPPRIGGFGSTGR